MSMEYIRKAYNVPARRGVRVLFKGREGVIVGSCNQYLRVRFGGEKRPKILHPTWCVEYQITPRSAP